MILYSGIFAPVMKVSQFPIYFYSLFVLLACYSAADIADVILMPLFIGTRLALVITLLSTCSNQITPMSSSQAGHLLHLLSLLLFTFLVLPLNLVPFLQVLPLALSLQAVRALQKAILFLVGNESSLGMRGPMLVALLWFIIYLFIYSDLVMERT